MAGSTQEPKNRRKRTHTPLGDAGLEPVIEAAVIRVLRAGGSDFIFPSLSGAEAAALMKAAGIVSATGKLTKNYR
jgi:hypothetical protein